MPTCFIRVSGGFGNQLFQYAFARNLKLSHGITAALDCSAYACPKHSQVAHQRLSLEAMDLPITFARLPARRYEVARRLHKWPGGFQRALTGLEFRKEINQPRLDRPEHWRGIVVNGSWQSDRWFKPSAPAILQDLRRGLALDNLTPRPGMISFHVRRGDYLKVGYMALLDYRALLDEARRHFRHVGDGDWTFLIFSDDPGWCREVLNGEDIVIRDRGDMLDDFRDMISCQHNVIANSSFSWWAAYLNANPYKVVCLPKRWRRSETSVEAGLVPAGWHVLDDGSTSD